MTIRHIKIFAALCACGCNTTKAAESLHMTQPAVSLAIREMEQYYGTPLFDRIGRRLLLTQAGEQFLRYAHSITGLFDDMEKELRNWDSAGVLRVGASITIGAQFLPSYIQAFSAAHPAVTVKAQVKPSEGLESDLLANRLDLALLEGAPHLSCLHTEEYMDDRLVVIAAVDSLLSQKQSLSAEEFRRQPLLLRERGSGTREEFERVMSAAGLSAEPLWEASSTTALVNAAIAGLGIAVLPYRMVVGPLERGLITTIQVEGLCFARRFHIVYHWDKLLTPLMQDFIELCRNYEMDFPLPRYNGLY